MAYATSTTISRACSISFVGAEPVPAGKPGKQKKRPVYPSNGSLIDDWHMCVKNLSVSSRENQALKLVEGHSGYWQSAGSQGKVNIKLNL